jgi:RimJ/RimL family protein N-acetyltransferase
MRLADLGLMVDYYRQATPEFLETLGVDPTRIPEPDQWHERFDRTFRQPIEKRRILAVIWETNGNPVGFSTTTDIVFGQQAKMHLHIVDPEKRRMGIGATCVRLSVRIYFDVLKLERLFCEPNAFNVAPNRTLQKAGFKYIKTHQTVPGPLNFHQPVTRWMLARRDLAALAG